MNLWIKATLVVLVILSTHPRTGMAMTGGKLLEYCTAKQSQTTYWMDEGVCTGYIHGVVGGFRLGVVYGNAEGDYVDVWKGYEEPEDLYNLRGGKIPVCILYNTTGDEVRRIVVKYIEEHPDKPYMLAERFVVLALVEAFPCH